MGPCRARSRAASISLGITLFLFGCVDEAARAREASEALGRLGDELWAFRLERDFSLRLREGLPVERLPPLAVQDAEATAEFYRGVLEAARDIDERALSHNEAMTLEAVIWDAEMAVEGVQYFYLGSFLPPYSNPLPKLGQLFAALPLETPEDLDRYAMLVSRVPAYIRSLHEIARGQMERGIVVPSPSLPAVIGLVRAHLVPPGSGPLWPDTERLQAFEPERVGSFQDTLARSIEEEINPALEELLGFLEGPYATSAPSEVGIAQYPGGEAYYDYLVRLNTTLDVTPATVEQAGYELLDELAERMAGIRDELGWEGTAETFHEHLRADPRYFPGTPDEVAERLQRAGDAMWEQTDRFFRTRPEAPYGVRRLAAELEPSMTYGYYQVPTASDPRGYYMYNGSRLDERSWIGLAAIGFHELIPGHHFQITRQWENADLPRHRREVYYTAYSEGWGSYASFLGLEADLYEDPYSRYGLYVLESFLATRLVVDPGMNYFGMTLEEGRRFMREHTLESDTQIASESLRYSTDLPGQALGYQMGKRELLELRSRAEAELGDRFDLRDFHEAVLSVGSLPLAVLERHIDWWIEQQRSD